MVSMFLKRTRSKNFTYLSIAETYREAGQVKHRILMQLGREDELRNNQDLQRLVASIARVAKVSAAPDGSLSFKDVREESRHNWGAVRVYRALWNLFDLDVVLQRSCRAKRRKFDLGAVVFAAVVQRLIRPCSKLKVYQCQRDYLGFEGIELEQLYRAMDCLAAGKDAIERELFERQRDLFNMRVDVVFYDVTTLYFESVREDDLREFGFSKDAKFGEVQIVLGLLVDMEGRPVGFDLFPGSTFEGHTLVTALKKLKDRFQLRQVIIVADRGLNGKVNLHEIKEAGFDYVVGSRLKNLTRSVQKDVLNRDEYTVLEKNEAGGIELCYRVLEHHHSVRVEDKGGGKKNSKLTEQLVCTWSRERAAKDGIDRERLVQKAKDLLATPSRMKVRRGARRFITGNQTAKPALDEERIREDTQWDGFYGIQSSRQNLTPAQILAAYHSLWKVEDSFRVIKHTLQARPIFHWTPPRVKGHLVMCFIAFLLERTLELAMKKTRPDATTDTIRDALASLQVSIIEADSQKLYLTSKLSGLAAEILRTVKIPAPRTLSSRAPLEHAQPHVHSAS